MRGRTLRRPVPITVTTYLITSTTFRSGSEESLDNNGKGEGNRALVEGLCSMEFDG
jgi:hypothetical protein